MKIKTLELKNYQKHEYLKLDFNNSLNVITGLTGTGKTAIYRALEWLFNCSNISEVDYRKEGTTETSVKAWFDNDFIVERIRSSSLNRYILSKDGCEDQVFDSFGRNIPEEIQKVFEITSIDIEQEHLFINFANQDQLNFILDSTYSDTFKAKLFNKLTGNELLDKLFKEFNKENLRINRETKETEENIVTQENQLAECSKKYKVLKDKLTLVKEQYNKLKEEIAIYENLKDLSEKLKTNKENQDFVNFKASQIKIVSEDKIKELNTKAEELKKLQELSYELEANNEAIEKLEFQKSKIKIVDVNFDSLKQKNELLQNLEKINQQLVNNQQELGKIEQLSHNIGQTSTELEKELKEVWEKNPTCPLCGKGKDQCHTNEIK